MAISLPPTGDTPARPFESPTAAVAARPLVPTLQRETFELSRTMEFFTERELTAQIGHNRIYWPVALLKELIDNALDACESADVAPVVTIDLQDDRLIVADNGPGLPLATLERSFDYQVRVSDKTGYVSPSRGQQGNALKTLWAAPFVVAGESRIEVATAAYRLEVRVTLDRIGQIPKLETTAAPTDVKIGTRITVHWPGIAGCLIDGCAPSFYSVIYPATDFNPHCDLSATVRSTQSRFKPTAPDWQHWRPDRPTAPHWYSPDRFRNLVALLLNVEQRGGKARTVNEFIREFHGLSATAKAKAIAAAANLTGAMLHDLVQRGDLDNARLSALLPAMKNAARPVKPEALGVLGQDHLAIQLQNYGAAADSIEYRRAQGTTDGLPYVLEVAFGVKQEGDRTAYVGINFSPAFSQPFPALDESLNEVRCTGHDPVALLIHLVCPHVAFSDRGKTRAWLPSEIAAELQRLVRLVTARFTRAKRQADRQDRMQNRDLEALLTAHKVKPMTTKDAAYQVMRDAYLKVSNNGTLPANARQIMYAARPLIIKLTGKTSPWKKSSTFTQQLLPDYITEHPEECADWDVVFDDRGHFEEPHTGNKIGVGTLAVRKYLQKWKKHIPSDGADWQSFETTVETTGPALRYRFVLFVEKEGFNPLLERARIAERFDIGLLSTKGVSVTAARTLVERLSESGVTTLVLHDFDKSGFTILHTLRTDTRRYRFKTPPNVINLGLRLEDVEELNLDSEAVEYGDLDPRPGMIERGATQAEADYLVNKEQTKGQWTGKRVELNAMDSQQFIDWLEKRLEEHGVGKFVPDDPDVLNQAWQRAWRIGEINKAISAAIKDIPDPPDPPPDLAARIAAKLADDPDHRWDAVISGITDQGAHS